MSRRVEKQRTKMVGRKRKANERKGRRRPLPISDINLNPAIGTGVEASNAHDGVTLSQLVLELRSRIGRGRQVPA